MGVCECPSADGRKPTQNYFSFIHSIPPLDIRADFAFTVRTACALPQTLRNVSNSLHFIGPDALQVLGQS